MTSDKNQPNAMILLFVKFKNIFNFLVNGAFVIFVNASCYAANDMKYAIKIIVKFCETQKI